MPILPRLSIPQPCAADWAAMRPDPAGRHCLACQKTVVDFTLMTAAEILAYLAQPGQEISCGRLRASYLQQPVRFLTWQAAPRLAVSVAAILALTHCTPEKPTPASPELKVTAVQDGKTTRGRLLDRDTRKPLAGALIICEADTLCQTRTDVDGRFTLVVPLHLVGSKLIAAMIERPQRMEEEEWLMPYIPHYFTAGDEVTVLLRRPPMIVGQTKLEPGETYTPAIYQYLVPRGAVPPPPIITTMKFTSRSSKRH